MTFDLADFESWAAPAGARLRKACQDATPRESIELGRTLYKASLHPWELNGDDVVDFVVVGRDEKGFQQVLFVVRRP